MQPRPLAEDPQEGPSGRASRWSGREGKPTAQPGGGPAGSGVQHKRGAPSPQSCPQRVAGAMGPGTGRGLVLSGGWGAVGWAEAPFLPQRSGRQPAMAGLCPARTR